MSREKAVVKTTLILALGTFLPRIISLATTPIISGYTTDTGFGIVNYLTGIILSFVVPVCTLQLEQAFFRFLVEADDDKRRKQVISSGIAILVLIGILISIICLYIPIDGFNGSYKYLIIGYIQVEILVQILRFVLRGFGKYKAYSISATIAVLVNFLALVVCVIFLKMGYIGVFVALTIADVVAALYMMYHSKIYKYLNIRSISKSTSKEMIYYSMPFIPNLVSWYINVFSDQLFLQGMHGYASYAIYAMALKIPSIVNIIYPAFNMAWIESAIKASKDDDIADYYQKMYKLNFCVVTAGSMLLMSGVPILYMLLNQNPDLDSGIFYVPVLLVATYFYCISQFFSSIYVALKQTKKMTISTAVGAAINLLLNVFLIEKFGISAAVFSTFVSNLTILIYRQRDINKNYYKLKVSIRIVVLSMIMFTISGFLAMSNSIILWIVNIAIALLYAYFLTSDLVAIIINKFRQRKA